MGEDYKAFVKRIHAMQSGEIIGKGDNLDALFFLKKSCESNGVKIRMELKSEHGTFSGNKVLVLYKA